MPIRPSPPASELPALKPNQPKARMNVPICTIGMWCGRIGLTLPSLPYLPMRGPIRYRGDQSQRTALQVHDAGAGVVDRAVAEAHAIAELREPAAAPHPAAEDRIDDRADEDAEDEEALEAPALRARAGHDRRGRVHEDHHEQEQHDRGSVVAVTGQEEPGRAEQAPAASRRSRTSRSSACCAASARRRALPGRRSRCRSGRRT